MVKSTSLYSNDKHVICVKVVAWYKICLAAKNRTVPLGILHEIFIEPTPQYDAET